MCLFQYPRTIGSDAPLLLALRINTSLKLYFLPSDSDFPTKAMDLTLRRKKQKDKTGRRKIIPGEVSSMKLRGQNKKVTQNLQYLVLERPGVPLRCCSRRWLCFLISNQYISACFLSHLHLLVSYFLCSELHVILHFFKKRSSNKTKTGRKFQQ